MICETSDMESLQNFSLHAGNTQGLNAQIESSTEALSAQHFQSIKNLSEKKSQRCGTFTQFPGS